MIEGLPRGRSFRPVITRGSGSAARLLRALNDTVPLLQSRIDSLEGDRQLLSAVLGSMQEAVLAVDSRRRLLFANPTANNLFDLGPESVGRLLAELVRSPQIQRAMETTLSARNRSRTRSRFLVLKAGRTAITWCFCFMAGRCPVIRLPGR